MRQILNQKYYNNVWFWIKIKYDVPDLESKVHKLWDFESKFRSVSDSESDSYKKCVLEIKKEFL